MTNDFTCKCPGPFGTARYTMVEAARMMFQCQRCKAQLVAAEPLKFVADKHFENDVADDSAPQVAPGANESDDPIQVLLKREADIKRRRLAGEFDDAPVKQESRKERKEREKREREQMSLQDIQKQLEENATTVDTDDPGDAVPDPWKDGHDEKKPPTLNDVRKQLDLDPIPSGDVPVMTIGESFRMIVQNLRKQLGVPEGINADLVMTSPDDDIPDVRIQYAHGIEYSFGWWELEPRFKDKLEDFVESWTARKNARLDFKARGRRWILNAELVAGIDYRD